MRGFQKFLLRGNVVDLAVAVVIGAAFGAVVTALVKDIVTPIIGIAGGLPDFSAWVLTIGASRFFIGDFINAVLSFDDETQARERCLENKINRGTEAARAAVEIANVMSELRTK